jgi:membrane protein involved in colicin uptake
MKKVFLAFAFIAALLVTSCNKKVETTTTGTDSTTVVVDSVVVDSTTVQVDTTKVADTVK